MSVYDLMKPAVALARPPRPVHVPRAVLDRLAGQPVGTGDPRDIWAVREDDRGRLVVTVRDAHTGTVWVDCRAIPDDAGRTGWLWDELRTGRPAPKTVRAFVQRGRTRPDPREGADDTPWTAADLDLVAARQIIPWAQPEWPVWVAGDPARARAIWLKLADRHGDPRYVAETIPFARTCRQIIHESGWLDPAELPNLDRAAGAPDPHGRDRTTAAA